MILPSHGLVPAICTIKHAEMKKIANKLIKTVILGINKYVFREMHVEVLVKTKKNRVIRVADVEVEIKLG